MIKTLRRWLFGTQDAYIAELHDLTVKCARRCAYDFGHALQFAEGSYQTNAIINELTRRQRRWEEIFQSGNSMKDYRHSLHHKIDDQAKTISTLRALLHQHGIKDPTEPDHVF